MNDAEFLKKLKEFDPDMADRWQKATGGKLASRIDGKKLEAILGPTFATGKITAKQAHAIDFLFVWSWMHFTKEAKAILWQGIEDAYILDYFFAGSKAQLASSSQLKDFNGAIGGSAGVIDFTSPPKDGTGLTYSADQYLAIKQLVSESKITVFEVDAAFLHAKAGFYRSDIDRLILYTGAWPVLRQFTTVHEVTHAIQDWNDVVANHEFCEADAYIAAAAAALAVDRSTFDAMKEYPAQQKAAELVVARKAIPSNPDWIKAYAAVVKAVKADPIYSPVIGTKLKTKGDGEKGKDEKQILADTMRKMKKAGP